MISKLLTSESKTVTGAALVIGLSTLVSRGIGIIRDRAFAYYFGAGPTMDAYYAAFKIPDVIFNLLIVGALTAGFIPTFTKLFYGSDDKTPAWRLASNIVTIVGAVLFVLCGLGMLLTPWLTTLLFPGFTDSTKDLAIQFTRIMFCSPFLLGISMVMGGILQSLKQFFTYSLAPVFYNTGIILGTIVLVPLVGPIGLALGVVIGAFLHMSVQLVGAYSNGYRWRWYFNLKDKDTRLIGKLMVPRTLGLAITQLNYIIVTALASLLPAGSVAVYNFANNLQAVPSGIIGIPFALAVFPVLSALANQSNKEEFISKLTETARKILFLLIPATVLILLLRAQIVRVVLGSGAFDWGDTIETANALAFFAFGLWAQSLLPLFARGFYALSNTKTPFVLGIIAELISIIFALILMRRYGVAGLALASSLGAIVNTLLLGLALRKKLGRMDGRAHLTFLYKISVAALAMGLVVQYSKTYLGNLLDLQYFTDILLQGLVSGTIGLLIYGLICYILRVAEMAEFALSFKKKWLKFWNIKEGIDEAEQL